MYAAAPLPGEKTMNKRIAMIALTAAAGTAWAQE
jgi:hypothetical protein